MPSDRKMSPREAKTFKQIFQLQSDNHAVKAGWIMIDGSVVVLCKQRDGEHAEAMVKLSRREFEALIDWYNRKQVLRAE